MRVIRTEIYFDRIKGAVNPEAEKCPGFSFVFLNKADFGANALGIYPDHAQRLFPEAINLSNFTITSFVAFADAALRGRGLASIVSKQGGLASDPDGLQNHYEAESVAHSGIVIETSPPKLISVEEALKLGKSAPAAGIFIASLSMYEPTLIITAPIGIIMMGAAFGISRALENGVAQLLQKKLKKMYG